MDISEREGRIQTICLLILSTIGVALALYWLRPVMVPFVLALFAAFGLAPLVDFPVRRFGVPRWIAITGTLLLGLIVFGLLGALLSATVTQLADNADVYQARLRELVERMAGGLPLERFGLESEAVTQSLTRIPTSTIGNLLLGTTNALVNALSQSLLVAIFTIYLLLGRAIQRGDPTDTWADAERRVQRYLLTKVVLSALTGVLVGVILGLLSVDLAMVFGLFAFLLNFIPSIGSVIATLLPLPVVIISPEISPLQAVLAILVPGVLQFAIGNVAEPKVMGDAMDLHPVTILLALIFWGMLWGIPGMLLATPITAVLKILMSKLEHTAALSDLLAGRLGSSST